VEPARARAPERDDHVRDAEVGARGRSCVKLLGLHLVEEEESEWGRIASTASASKGAAA
jgi:hypothetical protein